MEKDKSRSSTEPLKISLACPRCGGEVIANPVFSTAFCGVRIVASCLNGCTWSSEEQHEMDRHAGDEVYK